MRSMLRTLRALRNHQNAFQTCVLPRQRSGGSIYDASPAAFSSAARRSFASSSSLRQATELRPYQEESIQGVLSYLEKGEKRLGISLATGSGKTVIFSHLLDRIPAPIPEATQTLILAHRRELVEQAARHCRELYADRSVEIELGTSHASGLADITVASVQSILSGTISRRLDKYDPSRFKLVLVDEAHHIVAPTYLQVLDHFKLSDKDKGNRGHTALVGVSATLSRHDGLKLGVAIDYIVYHKDYIDMIGDNWLSEAKFTTVHSGADLSKVKIVKGDFQTSALSEAVNNNQTNKLTIGSWHEIAERENRKSTLVFCVDIAHVTALTETFRASGVDARFVTGDTPPKIRSERIAAFKNGKFPVMLNCGIFTEGTDIPNIDCVLLARPTQSRNLLIQMVGRGLRKFSGKEDCHIIDMVANLDRGIVTTPTLLGLDPNEIVKDATAQDMKAMKDGKDSEASLVQFATTDSNDSRGSHRSTGGEATFTHYESIHDLIESTSGERFVRQFSLNSWVWVGPERFVLPNSDGSYLAVRRHLVNFIVTVTRRLSLTQQHQEKSYGPFARPSIIAHAVNVEDAIRAADTYANEKFVPNWIRARAFWRRQPASRQQVEMLNKFREEGKKLKADDVNKGKAADMITKLKHGARGNFKKMKATKSKEEKATREQERRMKPVKVGPTA